MNIKELMQRRNEINYALIEADSSEYVDLQEELAEIEYTLEELSGETIEDLEVKFNEGEL